MIPWPYSVGRLAGRLRVGDQLLGPFDRGGAGSGIVRRPLSPHPANSSAAAAP